MPCNEKKHLRFFLNLAIYHFYKDLCLYSSNDYIYVSYEHAYFVLIEYAGILA